MQLSLTALDKSPQSSAVLLSLGNTERTLGNQIRDRWDYEQTTAIVDQKSQDAALAPYQKAFQYYTQAAAVTSAPAIVKTQAQLNHYKLLLENQAWWREQTNRRIVSWSRFGESKLIARAKDFCLNWNQNSVGMYKLCKVKLSLPWLLFLHLVQLFMLRFTLLTL